MAKKQERKDFDKKGWKSAFELYGFVKITDNTFSLNNKSEKSDWLWNRMNLYVDCGEKYGNIFCSLMGGYGLNRDNYIYVHGKDKDDNDDFENSYTIDFEDRFNESIISDLGRACFKSVTLEKDTNDKYVTKRFLSDFDIIEYLKDVLTDGTYVHIRGNLSYRTYNGNVTIEKNVTSISAADKEKHPYMANFRQTILFDRDVIGDLNKDKKTIDIHAYVLEKFKEFNGHDLTDNGTTNGKFVPLKKDFEYDYSNISEANLKKAFTKLFKAKKGVTQATFEGYFVEGGAIITATEDDIPDDIKELIEFGIMTKEEVLAKCADSSSREYRMLIEKPFVKKVTDNDGNVSVEIDIEDNKYSDDDLLMDCFTPIEEIENDDNNDDDEEINNDEDLEDWLKDL